MTDEALEREWAEWEVREASKFGALDERTVWEAGWRAHEAQAAARIGNLWACVCGGTAIVETDADLAAFKAAHEGHEMPRYSAVVAAYDHTTDALTFREEPPAAAVTEETAP